MARSVRLLDVHYSTGRLAVIMRGKGFSLRSELRRMTKGQIAEKRDLKPDGLK